MTRDDLSDHAPSARCHLLGLLHFEKLLELQARLVQETATDREARATILFCEHPPYIAIGRDGSRLDVRTDDEDLRKRQIRVRWVNRGGGTLVHAPGQLAVYAVVPLARFGVTVGEFLECWQTALNQTAGDVGLATIVRPDRLGLWGRGGQIGFVGIAVRHDVAYFGAYVNVDPPEQLIHLAATITEEGDEPSTLAAELRRPVRMPTVRQSLMARLSTALGCERYHVFTGHPSLPHLLTPAKDSARVE